MPYDFKLDQSTGDLSFDGSGFQFTTSKVELLRQKLFISFRLFVGDWVFSPFAGGIDRALLYDQKPSKEEVDGFYINFLNSFTEIDEITRYTSELNHTVREFCVEFDARVEDEVLTFAVSSPLVESSFQFPDPSENPFKIVCVPEDFSSTNELYETMNIKLPVQETSWSPPWRD